MLSSLLIYNINIVPSEFQSARNKKEHNQPVNQPASRRDIQKKNPHNHNGLRITPLKNRLWAISENRFFFTFIIIFI